MAADLLNESSRRHVFTPFNMADSTLFRLPRGPSTINERETVQVRYDERLTREGRRGEREFFRPPASSCCPLHYRISSAKVSKRLHKQVLISQQSSSNQLSSKGFEVSYRPSVPFSDTPAASSLIARVRSAMVPKTCFLLLSALVVLSNAFSATRTFGPRMITIEAPRTKTETEKKNRNRGGSRQTDTDPIPESEGYVDNALEWFIDDDEISREDDEPFHILLLNSTYAKPRITLQ